MEEQCHELKIYWIVDHVRGAVSLKGWTEFDPKVKVLKISHTISPEHRLYNNVIIMLTNFQGTVGLDNLQRKNPEW